MAKGTYYFHDQKRPKRPKRFRKAPAESSIGERTLKKPSNYSFPSRASSACSTVHRPPSALKVPSKLSTEDRLVSPNKGVGPNLPSVEANKKKALLDSAGDLKWTPQKERLLEAIEEEDIQERRLKYFSNFDEAKFAATGILSQLSKLIIDTVLEEVVEVPIELRADLQQDFEQLTEDVVVEKREWQTDCYIDWVRENRHPFYESRPEEEDLCGVVDFSVDKLVAKQRKRVTMAEGNSPERGKSPSVVGWKVSPSRPVSSLSIHSETLGSEFMYSEFTDEKDEGYDYLPPGLGVPTPTTPSLLKPQEESRTPTYNMKSQTRIEKRVKMEAAASERYIPVCAVELYANTHSTIHVL